MDRSGLNLRDVPSVIAHVDAKWPKSSNQLLVPGGNLLRSQSPEEPISSVDYPWLCSLTEPLFLWGGTVPPSSRLLPEPHFLWGGTVPPSSHLFTEPEFLWGGTVPPSSHLFTEPQFFLGANGVGRSHFIPPIHRATVSMGWDDPTFSL